MRKLICPTCYGALTVTDGATATCSINPHRFQVLHLRPGMAAGPVAGAPYGVAPQAPPPMAPPTPPPMGQAPPMGYAPPMGQAPPMAPPPPVPPTSPVGAPPNATGEPAATHCAQHPNVLAERSCALCGTPMCQTCAFPSPGGQFLCLNCVGQQSVPTASPVVIGAKCTNHPAVDAVARCASCSAPVCKTCDFVFEGDLHVCPACATRTETPLSPKRKKNLIISYVLAAVASLATILFLLAVATVTDEAEAELLGGAMMLFGFAPAAIGLGLGLSVRDRRLGTPAAVWGAVGWNGLVIAGMLGLVCLGIVSEAGM